jgi:hypothetical protein
MYLVVIYSFTDFSGRVRFKPFLETGQKELEIILRGQNEKASVREKSRRSVNSDSKTSKLRFVSLNLSKDTSLITLLNPSHFRPNMLHPKSSLGETPTKRNALSSFRKTAPDSSKSFREDKNLQTS